LTRSPPDNPRCGLDQLTTSHSSSNLDLTPRHVIFDQDAGVTRNYLGETVANIYSKPSPLGGKLFATVDGAARSVQATDDFGLRRSDHSFRSANIHADFGSLPAEGQRREVIQRAPPFGTSIIQSPLLQGLTRPALFGAGLQNLGRPQVITNLQTADRKLSIGSHDGLFNQPGIVQGQLLSPKEPTIPRGTLSDGGSVASSARRMERSSWYSNKQNEYDWTALDKQEIKKFKVYSKGFYVVKTHVDNEIEEEFRADVWRERQNRAPQAPQVIQSKAFESIPAKLSLPKPTGTVEMEYEEIKRKYYSDSKAAPSVSSQQSENKIPARTIFNQEQIHENPINAPSRSPTDARRTWPHNSQGRILNSEDFRSLLNAADPHQQQNGPYIYQKVEISEHPIGKTEFGDEVYGFDTRGYPIIDIEKSSRRPIYGFTPQSRTPVYGISREGFPQTHFDSFGRPFIGFDLSGLPVYDLKSSRYQVKELDTKHNAILGYTRDRRPIYDVSSANYIATGIDSKTGQFRYGYDWKWKPVLEDDIKKIEELVKSHPVVASDEYKAKIFGFDDDKNPIYSFTSDHKPIFGYTVDHCPVFGICKDGSFVLTFDPDMKPVYGFSSDFNPIYDPKIIQSGQKVFYPPGVELKVTDYGKLYDVWGRAVNKDKVVPISQLNNQAPSRRQSFSSADLDFYDQKGQQYPKVNLLLDEAGNPIPDFTMLINQKGQPISPGTPVYDQSGQKLTKNGGQTSARPVLDYTGQQIGFTYDGKNVLNAQNIPIALLSSSGKLKTLIPPLDLANYQKVENTLVNSQGKLIATIHPNNLITDINGITFGKLNRLGQIELDNELARQVEKVAMSLPLKHKFVPQLLLPNEKGKDALFSVSERNPQISPDQSPARVFSISPEGVVVGPDGQPVGKLSPGSSQGSHALKDDRGNVVAIMNDKGELLTVDGRQLGVLSKPTSAPAEKQKTEAVGAAQNTRAESLGDHYSEVFKSFVPDLSPTTNGKERYQVTARGDIVDTATGVSLGTIGIPSRPLTVPFAVHIDKALYDSRGSITGYVLRDGHIVNPQGMTIGQLDASAKEPKALRHFLSDNGEVIGTFDADMGTLTDPNGSLIAKAVKGDSEDIILVDASGRELARINSSGKLTGLIQGVHVNKEIFESASKGEKVDPAIIKSLLGESKPAEDTSQAKESKVELGGLLLLSQDGKPIGRVNDKNQVLAENGSILGSIGTNGRFHPSAEASRDVTAGALVDSHGKMIAKYTESNGFTTNDGKRIFENSVEKQPEVSMKRVGGYFIDDKGHLINKDNQPVGRIHGNQVMSMDNKQVAILNSDGSLSDLAGNRIAESGDIVDAQGVVLGQLHLLSKNEKILPLAKNVPVIADVEGHKIIGVTMNGDFVIGIDEIGQPILGKVGYNKDGVKIAAIDIEGKPLPQNFVEDVVKISTAVGQQH
jgi:hypothetical protein